MPWDMTDYPDSFKNFSPLLKKKTISIANALLAEGYSDDHAIPIAIAQAKKWMNEASEKEKETYKKEQNPQKNDCHSNKKENIDLLDNNVEVYFKDKKWRVKTEGAKKASDTFTTKKEAITRANEIAENKSTKVIRYKKDEDKE